MAKLIIMVAFTFLFSVCIGLLIKAKEPPQKLELIVRKDRLGKIIPIAIAQLAIKHTCEWAFLFRIIKELQGCFYLNNVYPF